MNYSDKIREIAQKKWPKTSRRSFIANCVLAGLSNDAAEYLYDGDGSKRPFLPTQQIVSKVLRTPKDEIFGTE